MKLLGKFLRETESGFLVNCPGCKSMHHIYTVRKDGRPCWHFDNKADAPTFTPSLLVWTDEVKDGDDVWPGDRCHSFIRAGQWQFLGDCTHDLKGQTVPMIPFGEDDDA